LGRTAGAGAGIGFGGRAAVRALTAFRATRLAGRAVTFRPRTRFALATAFFPFVLLTGLAFFRDCFAEPPAATRLRPGAVRLEARPAFRLAMF
jgi:hypothetical protein